MMTMTRGHRIVAVRRAPADLQVHVVALYEFALCAFVQPGNLPALLEKEPHA